MSEFALPAGRKTVIGMIHLQPLPGTPFHEEGTFREILERAVASAKALAAGGADGCLVQTVDRVYTTEDECDPARAVAMGLISEAVVRAVSDAPEFLVGVQIMRNALTASLAVAKVTGGHFIRAGALVGMTLSPHGMVAADPLAVAEYRQRISARSVGVIADVDSMHFRWFGGEKSTAEVARAARGMGADAVSLGDPDENRTHEMIASVRRAAPDLPVILAGHTDHGNAERLLAEADGAFVGTCLEEGGWGGRINVDRVRSYVDIARALESR
ncbi:MULTISPECIES: BtpA/SgcQ family protein [unclassified Streptomyces]|uniref:BtpA/SgcQ family protein n=1 Tax=unclassified Streptomyces TaxID=2593676 RepID=UPI003647457D